MSNADYQVSTKRTKKKNSRFVRVGAAKKQITCASAITTTFMSFIIERWALNVGRFYLGSKRRTPNAQHRTSNFATVRL
jgi:hypothetical protein